MNSEDKNFYHIPKSNMDNELAKLFEERQTLRESLLQLSDSLNNEGIQKIEDELRIVQNRIEYIMEDDESSHWL